MNTIRFVFKKILTLCFLFFYCCNTNALNERITEIEEFKVINVIKKAKSYIKKNGIQKAIIKFKNSQDIVIGNYDGVFFVSPLHPEQIGKNQFNYKDSLGKFVVQEEINKAKSGGGWLKGRWRYNSLTGTYQCRKIYILPVAKNYFIGAWYHYTSDKRETCPL